jgi:beta-1,4-mannosyl-glycoprotein beta-1,4-N-acetylglucosaminyltransferase
MKLFFWISIFFLNPLVSAEIYDCFTFFNELDLLKVRFEELYDHVDHFVLVEATHTFCGDPKPLYFEQNKAQFEQYGNKIIHIIVDDFPSASTNPAQDRWIREEFQRNAMMRGLVECKDHDIIIISDLDEIPNENAINQIKQFLNISDDLIAENHLQPICELNMRLFLFRLNYESLVEWNGAVKAALYWIVKKKLPWNLRILHLYDRHLPKIDNAGWHFHSMHGDLSQLAAKINSCYRYDTPSWQPAEFINGTLKSYQFKTISIDDSYPKYIKTNQDHFRNLGWLESLP